MGEAVLTKGTRRMWAIHEETGEACIINENAAKSAVTLHGAQVREMKAGASAAAQTQRDDLFATTWRSVLDA